LDWCGIDAPASSCPHFDSAEPSANDAVRSARSANAGDACAAFHCLRVHVYVPGPRCASVAGARPYALLARGRSHRLSPAVAISVFMSRNAAPVSQRTGGPRPICSDTLIQPRGARVLLGRERARERGRPRAPLGRADVRARELGRQLAELRLSRAGVPSERSWSLPNEWARRCRRPLRWRGAARRQVSSGHVPPADTTRARARAMRTQYSRVLTRSGIYSEWAIAAQRSAAQRSACELTRGLAGPRLGYAEGRKIPLGGTDFQL
jgi:hypothetical protein